ncbi:MAG TPA: hypothetical protein VGT41_02340 [Candidatus Babeliales bacterium]|nr:hypothetical protein [Candidatus Babeliales bacterium]
MEKVRKYSFVGIGLFIASLFGTQMTRPMAQQMFDTAKSYSAAALTAVKNTGLDLGAKTLQFTSKWGSKGLDAGYTWAKENPRYSKPIGSVVTAYTLYKIISKIGPTRLYNIANTGVKLTIKTISLLKNIITPPMLVAILYTVWKKELTIKNVTATVTVLDTQADGLHLELDAAKKAGAKAQELLIDVLEKYGATLETNTTQQRIFNPLALRAAWVSFKDMLVPSAIGSGSIPLK